VQSLGDEEVEMLGDKNAIATLPVGDMERARDFYENTLGLKHAPGFPEDADPGAIVYQAGSSAVLVYQSAYAGTNQATAASWGVGDDFDAIVDYLRNKGVTFEHYDDLPDTTREGDIHTFGGGGMKSVWFKDPDGNIINVGNLPT
jgi:catechol 2,3-dioxygenase-like lactoylglutathione lyase family enzyme